MYVKEGRGNSYIWWRDTSIITVLLYYDDDDDDDAVVRRKLPSLTYSHYHDMYPYIIYMSLPYHLPMIMILLLWYDDNDVYVQ